MGISLHGYISQWRFETLTNNIKERWIFAAASALSKCLPTETNDQGSQIELLPLFRHFYNIIRRLIKPQNLEFPNGDFCHQYGHLMARFAPLYLNSGYAVEGDYMFLRQQTIKRAWMVHLDRKNDDHYSHYPIVWQGAQFRGSDRTLKSSSL